ncbi:TPA: Arc family DNA-binding protein [Raoultella ornithinolytica]|uniref:Arc family DNA-binding protein n=1 Tax=Klebsiella/Raoultella group TaxID=2890311 RepID=UPI000C2859D1|nr:MULTISPECIES: Arc family DNA-binding protein [Klebsiella/Raoultella group]MBA7932946.1 Arc family DNA-binding protein [Klebsiella sp. RHBSTW-00215]PJR05437.1 hypothetical protein CDD79_29730 [Raoultella ornithinolytica]PQH19420.1 Arc family DNA-binding protein [Raoultella ornithinolytica]SPZ32247.1 Arc-like DNA binding domain [Raoultella planticola]HEQ2046419.1 Arc family DNA-binding protein [Raoultella ornithinolytica]
MARTDPQFNVRMPAKIKQQLTELAAENHRSINAEIIAAIQRWLEIHNNNKTSPVSIQAVAERVKELQSMVDAIASVSLTFINKPELNSPPSDEVAPGNHIRKNSNKTDKK